MRRPPAQGSDRGRVRLAQHASPAERVNYSLPGRIPQAPTDGRAFAFNSDPARAWTPPSTGEPTVSVFAEDRLEAGRARRPGIVAPHHDQHRAARRGPRTCLPLAESSSLAGAIQRGRDACIFVIPAVLRGCSDAAASRVLTRGPLVRGFWRRSPIACPTTGEHGQGVGLREHMMSVLDEAGLRLS